MTALRAPLAAVVASALTTLTVVAAARAADPAVAALAVAAVVAAVAVATRDASVANPAWSLTALLRGTLTPLDLAPLWAGHALGGLAGGLAGRLVLDRTTQQVVLETPETVVAALLLGAAALAGGWVAVTWEPGPVLATAPLAACAAIPAALTGALSPAALFGLGVAGLATWTFVSAAVLAVAAGAVAAAAVASLTAPSSRIMDSTSTYSDRAFVARSDRRPDSWTWRTP